MYITCLKTHAKNFITFFAKFSIQTLNKGEGITIGNALRRILLSNIRGIAFVGVRIKGVTNEFALTNFLKEDIIEVILNTKQIVLGYLDQPKSPIMVTVKFQGPGIITAKDIKMPQQLYVADKTQYIATVTTKKVVEIDLLISSGFGYDLNNTKEFSNKKFGNFLGIDSIFTPIRKVNYFVEKAKGGELASGEKLVFEIETNGTKSPSEVFIEAIKYLRKRLSFLQEESRILSFGTNDRIPDFWENIDLSTVKIKALGLSKRINKALKLLDIKTIEDLTYHSQEDYLTKTRFKLLLEPDDIDEIYQKLDVFNTTIFFNKKVKNE